jgi:hypothetical protein
MDRAGWSYPTGDFRVSDADRDRALSELGEALQAGRISTDEFGERSRQAVAARTGKELRALLTDLPVTRAPVARRIEQERAYPAFASRTAFAAGVAAMCCAALAAGNVLSHGPSLQQRDMLRKMARHAGVMGPLRFPPNPGFDWGGTVTPAVIALALVVLIAYLRVRSHRADGS